MGSRDITEHEGRQARARWHRCPSCSLQASVQVCSTRVRCSICGGRTVPAHTCAVCAHPVEWSGHGCLCSGGAHV